LYVDKAARLPGQRRAVSASGASWAALFVRWLRERIHETVVNREELLEAFSYKLGRRRNGLVGYRFDLVLHRPALVAIGEGSRYWRRALKGFVPSIHGVNSAIALLGCLKSIREGLGKAGAKRRILRNTRTIEEGVDHAYYPKRTSPKLWCLITLDLAANPHDRLPRCRMRRHPRWWLKYRGIALR